MHNRYGIYDREMLNEERRLMNEITAQKGMSWRKFGKIIQLRALMGRTDPDRNNGIYPRW